MKNVERASVIVPFSAPFAAAELGMEDQLRALIRVYPGLSDRDLAQIAKRTKGLIQSLISVHYGLDTSFSGASVPLANCVYHAAADILEEQLWFRLLTREEKDLLRLCFLFDSNIRRVASELRKPFSCIALRMVLLTRKLQQFYLYENNERFLIMSIYSGPPM